MLVLSRKQNESIIIADNVRVVVLDVRGDRVRLGIDAPQAIKILRGELYTPKFPIDGIAAVDSPPAPSSPAPEVT